MCVFAYVSKKKSQIKTDNKCVRTHVVFILSSLVVFISLYVVYTLLQCLTLQFCSMYDGRKEW